MASSVDLSFAQSGAAPKSPDANTSRGQAEAVVPARSIAKIFAAEVVSKVILGLSHVVTIGALSVADFGRFSYLYATAFVTVNVTGVALNRATMVRSAQSAVAGSVGAPRVLLPVLTAVALLLLVAVAGQYSREEVGAIALFSTAYLLVDHLRCVRQSDLRFREYALIELVRATLITAATFAAVAGWRAPGGGTAAATPLLYLQGTSMFLGAGAWVLWERRRGRRAEQPAGSAALRSRMDSGTIALFAYFAAQGLLGQVEIFVLKRLGTEVDLAVFSAAFRYYTLLLLATGAVNAVLIPLAQRADSARSFLRLLHGGRVYFILFGFAALLSAPALYVLSPLLGLAKYPGFFAVYCVLCLASIQAVFLSPHIGALMNARRYRYLIVLAYCTFAMSVIACVMLVGQWGAVGAALSYTGANLLMNYLAYRKAHTVARADPVERA